MIDVGFTICKKLTFSTRSRAKQFLKRIGKTHKQRAYKCPFCQYFHNTSVDSIGRQDIKEINSRKN